MQWHLSPICCGGSALEPQGLGSQGSSATTGSIATKDKEDLEISLLVCFYVAYSVGVSDKR